MSSPLGAASVGTWAAKCLSAVAPRTQGVGAHTPPALRSSKDCVSQELKLDSEVVRS